MAHQQRRCSGGGDARCYDICGVIANDGLINGVTRQPEPPGGKGRGLLGLVKKKRRAARTALGRKAAEPLPGADGR